MKPHRIDVHHHFFPTAYLEAATRHDVATSGDIAFPAWSVENTLEFLPEPLVGQMVRGVATFRGFDAAERQVVERDAALALFPRLRG